MKVVKKTNEARDIVFQHRVENHSIGLVPTMGALHDGHISLVNESLKVNRVTIVTIFINPIQFNNPDDFANYPVSVEVDLKKLEGLGVDYVFLPSGQEIYPETPLIDISFGHLDKVLEGKYRPGHFNGVAIIVAKLLNILTPTKAYFGQKDLQQLKIIEQLVNDLSINVEIVRMPIIREMNGLALSSRNSRLSEQALEISSAIYKSLTAGARIMVATKDGSKALAIAREELKKRPEIEIEYLELVNFEDLRSTRTYTKGKPLVLCFAGMVEGVRLIDNIVVGENREL